MICYRISPGRYANRLDGYGAYLNGGRWNRKGTRMLYTASNASLAYLETLVHFTSTDLIPENYKIVTLNIKGGLNLQKVGVKDYEQYRKNDLEETRNVGEYFFEKGHLGFKAQSFIVKNEYNIMLNPNHPVFEKKVEIISIEGFNFDNRFFENK